ncbi:MAG: HdeD family acid-resistance protein [Planctomycetota bacterium]|jgi:uncharacterized membrane protein HdeD (DUF308 family)
MENPVGVEDAVVMAELRGYWRVFRDQGIAFIVIGVLAILAPFVFALATAVLLGIALLLAGGAQGMRVYEARGKERILVPAATAARYVIVGVFLLFNPGRGVEMLTAVITILLFAQGIFQLVAAWQLRPTPAYGYVSGIISVLLAAAIWMRMPGSATWVIGTLVGVSFLVQGGALVALSKTLRSPA